MEKMREEFEAYFNYQTEGWAEYSRESSTWVGIDEISATALALLNIRWEAWKASRESFVLHLPHMADYVNMLGQVDKCYSYLDDLHAAIHAAGIRTK